MQFKPNDNVIIDSMFTGTIDSWCPKRCKWKVCIDGFGYMYADDSQIQNYSSSKDIQNAPTGVIEWPKQLKGKM